MRPKPATKRASRGAMRQKEKSASSKFIACSGNRAAVVGLGDRQSDARVLLHVLGVPGEAADMHVERGEVALWDIERHRHHRRCRAQRAEMREALLADQSGEQR